MCYRNTTCIVAYGLGLRGAGGSGGADLGESKAAGKALATGPLDDDDDDEDDEDFDADADEDDEEGRDGKQWKWGCCQMAG